MNHDLRFASFKPKALTLAIASVLASSFSAQALGTTGTTISAGNASGSSYGADISRTLDGTFSEYPLTIQGGNGGDVNFSDSNGGAGGDATVDFNGDIDAGTVNLVSGGGGSDAANNDPFGTSYYGGSGGSASIYISGDIGAGASINLTEGVFGDGGSGNAFVFFDGAGAQTVEGVIQGTSDGDGDVVVSNGNHGVTFSNLGVAGSSISRVRTDSTDSHFTVTGDLYAKDVLGAGKATLQGDVTASTLYASEQGLLFGGTSQQAIDATQIRDTFNGPGIVTIDNSAGVSFNGVLNNTGDLILNQGELSLIKSGSLTVAANVAKTGSGTLAFTNNPNVTVSGDFHLDHNRVNWGSGLIDFKADLTSAQAVSSGGFRFSGSADQYIAALTGAGEVEVTNTAGTVTFANLGGSSTALNTLSGDGNYQVSGDTYVTTLTGGGGTASFGGNVAATDITGGSGLMNFQGNVQASNSFVVSSGGLRLNGSQAQLVTGDLTGTGAVSIDKEASTVRFAGNLSQYTGTMAVDRGALAIAAGETLTLGGDYTQATNGVLRTQVTNDSNYGKLVVNGTATLPSDMQIDVAVSDPQFDFSAARLANVLTAGTLVSDNTFSVTDNSYLFDFGAEVNGNAVDLTLTTAANGGDPDEGSNEGNNSDGATPSVVAASKNHYPSAVGIASVLDSNIQSYADNGTSGDTDMDRVIERLGTLSTAAATGQAAAQTVPLFTAGSRLAVNSNLKGTNQVIQSRQSGLAGRSSGNDFLGSKHVWVKPFGSRADQDNHNDVSGYNADIYGIVFGADAEISSAGTLGVALAYASSEITSNDALHEADVDSYQFIVYGSHELARNTEMSYQVDYGRLQTEANRNIVFMDRIAEADYDSSSFHVGSGLAHTVVLTEGTEFTPGVRLDYARLDEDAYAETGAGALNLNVEDTSTEELMASLNGELSHDLTSSIRVTGSLAFSYDLINDGASLTAAMAGAPDSLFVTKGLDLEPWSGNAGVGLVNEVSDRLTVMTNYDYFARESYKNQTLSLKLRWLF